MLNNKFNKSTIHLLTSCDTEERIAQNIYIHNSNRNYKRINYNNNSNISIKLDRHSYKNFKSNAQDSGFA